MPNNFTSVVERLAPFVKDALRNQPAAFRWIQSDFNVTPGSKGDTIGCQFPVIMTARNVVPGPVSVAPAALTPTKRDLVINQWQEVPFALTYQEALTVTDEYLAQQSQQAVEAMVAVVEGSIFSVLASGTVSTISASWGSTPYANVNSGMALLDRGLALASDRTLLVNTYVKNKIEDFNAGKVGTFQMSNVPANAVQDGNLGKFGTGARMHYSHLVPAGQNVLFHRGAAGIVVRTALGPEDVIITDPISGMPFVLRQKDEHYQTYISVSCLWGVQKLRDAHVVLYSNDF